MNMFVIQENMRTSMITKQTTRTPLFACNLIKFLLSLIIKRNNLYPISPGKDKACRKSKELMSYILCMLNIECLRFTLLFSYKQNCTMYLSQNIFAITQNN